MEEDTRRQKHKCLSIMLKDYSVNIKHITFLSKLSMELGTVVLAFNTSKWISISDRPAFSTEWVPGHPGQLDRKALSR